MPRQRADRDAKRGCKVQAGRHADTYPSKQAMRNDKGASRRKMQQECKGIIIIGYTSNRKQKK